MWYNLFFIKFEYKEYTLPFCTEDCACCVRAQLKYKKLFDFGIQFHLIKFYFYFNEYKLISFKSSLEIYF